VAEIELRTPMAHPGLCGRSTSGPVGSAMAYGTSHSHESTTPFNKYSGQCWARGPESEDAIGTPPYANRKAYCTTGLRESPSPFGKGWRI
jgi:hypothetical protein